MKKQTLDIQQMFEELPSATRRKKPELGTKEKTPSAKPSAATLATKIPATSHHRHSSLATPRKSRNRSRSTERQVMTPNTAIQKFGDKLTAYELEEIKTYPKIFCLGLMATKIGAGKELTTRNNHDFDDSEHFYRVVPNDHIGYRYEIPERPILGKGTFGQVIKAFDMKEEQYVALKIVRNERDYLKQSREELRILHVLKKHDVDGKYNIVVVKEFFIFRNHMVMSFELLGMNLYQVIKLNMYRGLQMSKVKAVAKNILKSLELLFRLRIIHCDIKPENILFKRNGDFTSVKLADFGSSCYEQTQIYQYIQSRYYRAPEVILGFRYGPAIDMWSLGCVLGELSKGLPIFAGEDEFDQLAAIEEALGPVPSSMVSKSRVRPPRRKDRGPPGSRTLKSILIGDDIFKDVIRQMLEINPEVRPTPAEITQHQWFRAPRLSVDRSQTSQNISTTSSFRKMSRRESDF